MCKSGRRAIAQRTLFRVVCIKPTAVLRKHGACPSVCPVPNKKKPVTPTSFNSMFAYAPSVRHSAHLLRLLIKRPQTYRLTQIDVPDFLLATRSINMQ